MVHLDPGILTWLSLRAPWTVGSLRNWHLSAVALAHRKIQEDQHDGASWFFLGFLYGLQVNGGRRAPALIVEDALLTAHSMGFESAKSWVDYLLRDAVPTQAECDAVQKDFLQWLSICSLSGDSQDTRIVGCLIQVGLYWQGSVAKVDRDESATWYFLATRLGYKFSPHSVAALLDKMVDHQPSCQMDIKRFRDWMAGLAQEGALSPFRDSKAVSPEARPSNAGGQATPHGPHETCVILDQHWPHDRQLRHAAEPSRDSNSQHSGQRPLHSAMQASAHAAASTCGTSSSNRPGSRDNPLDREERMARQLQRSCGPAFDGDERSDPAEPLTSVCDLLWRVKRVRSPRVAVETWSIPAAAVCSSLGTVADREGPAAGGAEPFPRHGKGVLDSWATGAGSCGHHDGEYGTQYTSPTSRHDVEKSPAESLHGTKMTSRPAKAGPSKLHVAAGVKPKVEPEADDPGFGAQNKAGSVSPCSTYEAARSLA